MTTDVNKRYASTDIIIYSSLNINKEENAK